MSLQYKKGNASSDKNLDGRQLHGLAAQIVETDTHYLMPKDLNNGVAIPKKFFDAKGEMDLRLATGEEACQYLRAIGLDLPPVIRM